MTVNCVVTLISVLIVNQSSLTELEIVHLNCEREVLAVI